MKSRIFTVAAVAAAALIPAAHGTVRTRGSAQPQTTEPTVFVDVHVEISNTRIVLDRNNAQRGNEVRFIIRNVGTKPHGFTLGTMAYGRGKQTGFSRTLKPNEEKILLLYLDYRGKLPYYGSLKADLGKPGMKGIFTIN